MSEEKPSVWPSAPQQPTSKKSWIKWCLVVGIVLICSCPFLVVAAFFLTQASGMDPGKEVLAAVLGKMAITLPLVGFFMELLVWLNVFKNKQRKRRLKTPPPLPERESSNQGGEKIKQTFPTFFQLGRYLRTFKGRGMELAITTLIYVLMAVTIPPLAVMASFMVRGRGLSQFDIILCCGVVALVCITSKKQRQKN